MNLHGMGALPPPPEEHRGPVAELGLKRDLALPAVSMMKVPRERKERPSQSPSVPPIPEIRSTDFTT